MKKVELEWDDSVTQSTAWSNPDEIKRDADAMRCTTVGYLVHETPRSVTVAQSLSFNADGEIEEFGQPITIPRVALTAPIRQLTQGQ